MPNGGIVVTALNKEEYDLLVQTMNNEKLIPPKYYSITYLANIYKQALKNSFYNGTVFFGTYFPFIKSKANRKFMNFCSNINIDINDYNFVDLGIFLNIYQIYELFVSNISDIISIFNIFRK